MHQGYIIYSSGLLPPMYPSGLYHTCKCMHCRTPCLGDPGSPEQNLELVWSMIRRYYDDPERHVSSRYGGLRLSMFTNDSTGYPNLKGKASEIRQLGPALLWVFEQGMDPREPMHVTVRALLQASVDMEDILTRHPSSPCLPPVDADLLLDRTLTYCQLVSQLRNWNNLRLFRMTVKFHYLLHSAYLARYVNPRTIWCFRGEDYMSKVKRVIASCCRGNNLEDVSKKTLKKVTLAMHCQFTGWARDC